MKKILRLSRSYISGEEFAGQSCARAQSINPSAKRSGDTQGVDVWYSADVKPVIAALLFFLSRGVDIQIQTGRRPLPLARS
ncbi:hypothetical protein Plhal304r1_c018g0063521 [Plasmopara halstedii]